MNIDIAINLDDLRKLAKKKLPKIAFDYLEGGVDDERCLEGSENHLAGILPSR